MVVSWHHGFMVLFHGTMIPHHGTTVPYHGHGTIPCHYGTIPWDSRDLSKWFFLGPVSIKHQHAENSKMNKKISWGVLFLSEKIIKNISWGVFWEEYLSSKSRKEVVGGYLSCMKTWRTRFRGAYFSNMKKSQGFSIYETWTRRFRGGDISYQKNDQEDFGGEYFVFCHIGEEKNLVGGWVAGWVLSCMKKMKNTISWGVIYGKNRVCFIYEEMIKKISWGVFRGEIFSYRSRKEVAVNIFHVWENEEQEFLGIVSQKEK